MDGGNKSTRHEHVLCCLSSLPRKIMAVHELENVPEFVLQDICNENCFNIIRAAYFIDNPDFDQCKGVAGFCQKEAYQAHETMWEHPQAFSQFMQESQFNQQVRALTLASIARNNKKHEQIVHEVAPQLNFINPAWCTWDLKHYNHGLIIYEKADLDDEVVDQHFLNTLYVLGFCAIR